MSSLPVGDDDASARLEDVLRGVDGELEHLRALRASGTSGDQAARALRARGEHETTAARSAREHLDDADARAS